MINCFFSRPGTNKEIEEKLISEISKATNTILVANAYFTSDNIVDTLVKKSGLPDVRVILNKGDASRDKEANTVYNKLIMNLNTCLVGTEFIRKHGSNMHHKFLIIDQVVWVGSYNLTEQAATRNWESLLRIDDQEVVVNEFRKEFEQMWIVGLAIKDKLNIDKCKKCGDTVTDPLSHYKVVADSSHLFSDDFYHVTCYKDEELQMFGFNDEYKCNGNCGKNYKENELITFSNGGSVILQYCKDCLPKNRVDNVKLEEEYVNFATKEPSE